MKVTGFNGFLFSALGVSAKTDESASGGPNRQQQEQPRLGGDPLIPQVVTGGRLLTVVFQILPTADTEAALQGLIGRLSMDDPSPAKLLTGVTNTAVAVQAYAHALTWRQLAVNTYAVDFVMQSTGWQAVSTTTLTAAATKSANGTLSIANQTGKRDAYPTLLMYYAGTARVAPGSPVGKRYRMGSGLVITNTGIEPIRNQPYQIGPINHKALVAASKSSINGDDLAVFCEGKELRRNVIGANGAACFLWVILPDIEPGQAVTLDVVYNQGGAGATLTYASTPQLPAMDISGDRQLVNIATTTVITIGSSAWETNQWAGGTLICETAAGAMTHMRRILSNTANTITVSPALPAAPSAGDFITIMKSGLDGRGRTATSGTSSTLVDTTISYDSTSVGAQLSIYAGTGSGQTRTVSNIAGNTMTVTPNWTTAPDATSQYRLYRRNGHRMWDTRTVKKSTPHKGLWLTSKSETPPPGVTFDAPASWYRFTYLRNDDSYSQPRYTSYLIGGTDNDHFPVMNLRRSRKGKAGTQMEVGVADAVGTFCPFRILDFYLLGYDARNAKKAGSGSPGSGMTEFRVMAQETGGENWATVYSDTAIYSSLTPVGTSPFDFTGFGSINRIGLAVIPNGGDEIPESDNNTAQWITDSLYWELRVDPGTAITDTDWFTSPPTEVEIYDLWLRFTNKGATPTRPYNQLEVGGPERRLFIAATDERVQIDCEAHRVTLVTNAGAYVKDIPWAVQAFEVVDDVNGSAYTRVDGRWLPVPIYPGDTSRDIAFTDPSGGSWGTVTIATTVRLGYFT